MLNALGRVNEEALPQDRVSRAEQHWISYRTSKETEMKNVFTTALALVLVASVPTHLKAAPQGASVEPMTAKQVHTAEANAKTKADHFRLAACYRSKAQQSHAKLADAEVQLKNWSWMEGRTKVPNPYTSSKSLVDQFRGEVDKYNQLAANHEKLAQSLPS